MVDLEMLADKHLELCDSTGRHHKEQLILWYADLGVLLGDEEVEHYCPECGEQMWTDLDEFVLHDSRDALQCLHCRGDVEERAGALD